MARKNQLELFTAYAANIAPKDQRDLMSRSWFSIWKKKRIEPIEHRFHDPTTEKEEVVRITTTSEEHGIATIWDQDLILFAISQWVEAMERGEEASRYVWFTPYEFFLWQGKSNGGRDYRKLKEAIDRLFHTKVETTVRHTGGAGSLAKFTWVSEYIVDRDEKDNVRGVAIVLPEWLFQSVTRSTILTLNTKYFGLTGGLERWLYLYARKSTGYNTDGWAETVESLYEKSAALSERKEFSRMLRKIVEVNQLPDYSLELVSGKRGDKLLFRRRSGVAIPEARKKKSDSSSASKGKKPGSDKPRNLRDIWHAVKQRFEADYGESISQRWVDGIQFVSLEDEIVTLGAPTGFIASQVENHYSSRLADYWRLEGVPVRFTRVAAPGKDVA